MIGSWWRNDSRWIYMCVCMCRRCCMHTTRMDTLIKYSLLMSVIRLIYHVIYYYHSIDYFIWLGFHFHIVCEISSNQLVVCMYKNILCIYVDVNVTRGKKHELFASSMVARHSIAQIFFIHTLRVCLALNPRIASTNFDLLAKLMALMMMLPKC